MINTSNDKKHCFMFQFIFPKIEVKFQIDIFEIVKRSTQNYYFYFIFILIFYKDFQNCSFYS